MKFSTRFLLSATAIAALTFSLAIAIESAFALSVVLGVISLVMIASLATPFFVRTEHRPFWAAYALCTAFTMLMADRENDPFEFLWNLPIHVGPRDPPPQEAFSPGLAVFFFLQPWIPALIGAVGGIGFHLAFKFLCGNEAAQNNR